MPLSIDIFNKKILSNQSNFGTFNVLLSGDVTGGTGREDVNTIVIENSATWIGTSTAVQSNSANWNEAYNIATIVQANSASWEESSEILPTVTNYLSSSNVLLSALTVTTDISAQGLIYSKSLTPNLPVPKIGFMGPAYGNTTAEYLTGGPGTWGVGGLINLTTVPYVRVLDFTQEDLNNNQIFIEMVIFKRRQRKASWNVEGLRSYVAPTGNATPPWGNNFWQRSGDQSIDPENPKLFVTRYNHLSVTNLGQTIPLTNCLNGHFVEKVISYLDPTSNDESDYRTINCLVPSGSKKSVLSTGNLNRSKFPYVRTYKPLYMAFRYICWLPNNNNGRGQIISGPLSPTIKVANSIFPFDINHYQSSLKGFPVCNLNPIFDKTSFTCKFC